MIFNTSTNVLKKYSKPILVVVFFLMLFTAVVVHAQTASTTDERLDDRASEDLTRPIITLIGPESVTITEGDSYTDEGATASDDVDGDITADIVTVNPVGSATAGVYEVTYNVSDSAGNSAREVVRTVEVEELPIETATTTPETTDTGTTTPTTTDTGTTTDSGAGGSGGDGEESDPNSTSVVETDEGTGSVTSSANSGEVDPSQSNTDNSDFENISEDNVVDDSDLPEIDASATTTEFAIFEPELVSATGTDGTGNKIGSTIFTGKAVASTTVKNILNITRSSVDGPGVTNSSRITADTDNTAVVTTVDDTKAFTGENTGDGGEGDAIIDTGDAISSARVLNVVNTNFFNSNGLVLFLNPKDSGGIDLRGSDLSYFLDGRVGASPTNLGCTILTCLNSSTLKVLNRNEAELNNEVLVRASTGSNIASTTKSGNADIRTGNSYASAAVLNMVNTNFINSKYLVAAFDNFGDMQGDVVLPNDSFFRKLFENGNTLPEFNSGSYVVSNDNTEVFTGTTTANAITGGNSATSTAEGRGRVRTGEAYSSATSYTAANQTYVGGSSVLFVFHVSGDWSGSVKGLPQGLSWRRTDYGVEVYSNGLIPPKPETQGIYNSGSFIASSTNEAIVNTNVNVWAETGDNGSLSENGTSIITTGDAYASANVVNMVNTNVVNRNFMFAVFNVAGDWNGDIAFGGHSPDLNVTATVGAPSPTLPESNVDYRFVIENSGDVAADNTVLSTTYNKDLIFISNSSAISTDTSAGTDWYLGRIAPGESRAVDAVGVVSAPGLTSGFSVTVPLTASVSSDTHDQDNTDNTQTVSVVVFQPGGEDTGGDGGDDTGTGDTGNGDTGGGDSGDGSRDDARDDTRGGDDEEGDTGGGGGGGGGGSAPPPSGGGGGGGGIVSSGGGGGGSVGGIGGASDGRGQWTPDPIVTMSKKASTLITSAPTIVDYDVVVRNEKEAGPVHNGILTDTMTDPFGEVMYTRAWELGALEPGDEIQLSYSVEFATSTEPGLYKNTAKVTGQKGNTVAVYAVDADIFEVSTTIEITSNGLSSGVGTTSPTIATSTLTHSKYVCEPLITKKMRRGRASDSIEVVKLQGFLNQEVDAGLPLTGYFGPLTQRAVIKFQEKYTDEVLAPWDLTRGTGVVGSTTIKKINELACPGGSVAESGDQDDTPTSEPETTSVPATVSPTKQVVKKPTLNTASAAAATDKTEKKPDSNGGGLLNTLGTFLKLW